MKLLVLLVALFPLCVFSQQNQSDREVLKLARDVIEQVRYGALITVDEDGQPRSRIVDAFIPDEDFVIYIATRPNTRKVAQLRLHDEATLFYFDQVSKNTVSIMGQAVLIDDIDTKVRLRREADTDRLYPDFPDDYILIRLTPLWLEGLLPGYRGDPENWQQVKVLFTQKVPSE